MIFSGCSKRVRIKLLMGSKAHIEGDVKVYLRNCCSSIFFVRRIRVPFEVSLWLHTNSKVLK